MNQTAFRTTPHDAFGTLLRKWRQARGVSQLDLALSCGASQRHLSFLESGRARPSRGMVLQLAVALNVPLRHQNGMLLAAGFAPAFGPQPADAPALAPVNKALDHAMGMQEPFPAVVVDRHYTLLRANRGAQALLAFAAGGTPPEGPINLVQLMLGPHLRDVVENWAEVATWMVRRLRAEALLEDPVEGGRSPLAEMLDSPELETLAAQSREPGPMPPVLPTRFRRGEVRLSLFSMIATIGTPLDASLQDLRLELFYPMDEATTAWFRAAVPAG